MRFNDRIWGALLLGFAIVIWYSAQDLPNPGDQLYGPAFFPEWIALALGISAAVMLGNSLIRGESEPLVSVDGWLLQPAVVARFLLVPALVIFYVYAVDELGFLLTAALVLAVMLLSLGVRVRVALPTTAGIVLLVYGIFDIMLRVPLPRGDLFFS